MIKKVLFSGSRIRLVWPFAVVILLIALGEILLVEPFEMLLKHLGLREPSISNAQELSHAVFEFLKRAVRVSVVLLAIWTALKYLLDKNFSFTGFVFKKGWRVQLILGVFFGFTIQLTAILLMAVSGWYQVTGFLWQSTSLEAVFSSMLFALIIGLETGVMEETFFRGFVMNTLSERFGLKTGVIVSSLIFGFVHFSGFSIEFPWWLSLISAIIGGFFFAQAYLLYNAIWVPLGIHFAWHFAARILGSPGVNLQEATVLITDVNGPVTLVCTKYGGASVFELVGLGICSLIIYVIHRKRGV